MRRLGIDPGMQTECYLGVILGYSLQGGVGCIG